MNYSTSSSSSSSRSRDKKVWSGSRPCSWEFALGLSLGHITERFGSVSTPERWSLVRSGGHNLGLGWSQSHNVGLGVALESSVSFNITDCSSSSSSSS